MISVLRNGYRLFRAGRTLAAYDALLTPDQFAELPWTVRLGFRAMGVGSRKTSSSESQSVVVALSALGPSYIKLGQFLATRPDLVGPTRAFALRALQDRLPPFQIEVARAAIRRNLGRDPDQIFAEFGPSVAAASIAQVHKATGQDGRTLAVKILRPGIDRRFARDLESFYFAARALEKWSKEARRLRPVAAVRMLEQSMKLELDLRMEAAALSEMAENIKDDPGFRVPRVEWSLTAREVLVTEWIDGTPISDVQTLVTRGLDTQALGDTVIQSFLRHAIRDGFFHADMHQGNLFVDSSGLVVAVDFGIMGRLGPKESMFLAEILHGFITRNYSRVSAVHFEAGYIPSDQDPAAFAQALRAIGEPIMDLSAHEISMARLLTQLFEVTAQFKMQAQPQLLLLQKTMVVVEGVARALNPNLNMWATAEPVVRTWIERKLGPAGRMEEAAGLVLGFARVLPLLVGESQRVASLLSGLTTDHVVGLDSEADKKLAKVRDRGNRWGRLWLAIIAVSLASIAVHLMF